MVLRVLQSLVLIAFALLQACQYSESKASLQTQSFNPVDLNKAATYNVQLGLEYLKQGDRILAKKKLLTALEEAPRMAEANAAMAYFFEQTADIEQSKPYYLKAIAYATSKNDSLGAQYNNYGAFLCRQGEYTKAEHFFLKAVKEVHYLKTAQALENAGLCSLALPDETKAKRYFAKALKQDPSRKQSLLELAKLEGKQGGAKSALVLLNKYPELVLKDPILLVFAKGMASKAGDVALAEKYDNKLAMINSGVANEYNDSSG